MGKGQSSFQQMVVRKLDIHVQKTNLGPYFTPCTKLNSKDIINLNVRANTLKLLEENTGEKFHDTGFGSDFWEVEPKAQATKGKTRYAGLNIKKFCA